jgi:FkbM family methyltransferase
MNYFIDLGAYDGDTLEKALLDYPAFDHFYAFEPTPGPFKILQQRYNSPRITLINKAAYVSDGTMKLYLVKNSKAADVGNSILREKSNVSDDYIEVDTCDFNHFMDGFKYGEEIVLKMNIEGAEYELLELLLTNPKFKLVKKLYCEWHWDKIHLDKSRHDNLVKQLNDVGLNMSGDEKDWYVDDSYTVQTE